MARSKEWMETQGGSDEFKCGKRVISIKRWNLEVWANREVPCEWDKRDCLCAGICWIRGD